MVASSKDLDCYATWIENNNFVTPWIDAETYVESNNYSKQKSLLSSNYPGNCGLYSEKKSTVDVTPFLNTDGDGDRNVEDKLELNLDIGLTEKSKSVLKEEKKALKLEEKAELKSAKKALRAEIKAQEKADEKAEIKAEKNAAKKAEKLAAKESKSKSS